jgi:glucans biosynthesis protein
LAAALVALAGCAAAGENDALDRHLDAAFETAWSAGHQPSPALPPGLAKLDYDDWRKIVFNREKKDWLNLQFRLEPFHRGFLHRELVRLYLIDPQGHLAERPYRPDDWFDHVPTKPEDRPADLGHPGIKIIADLNKPGVPDEVMSLIGGSYFRALGPGHAYGASCRVVALDPGGRETFPRFTALYLRQPAPGERFLDIGALVDSPEILARVRFRLVPGGNAGPSGNETIVETQVRVRARQTTPKIVLAPITSMFLHDQDWGRRLDFRP